MKEGRGEGNPFVVRVGRRKERSGVRVYVAV
jgi:hypothetical protein